MKIEGNKKHKTLKPSHNNFTIRPPLPSWRQKIGTLVGIFCAQGRQIPNCQLSVLFSAPLNGDMFPPNLGVGENSALGRQMREPKL